MPLDRKLGLFDLTLLLIIAVVNLNLIPVVAGSGLSVMFLWGLAFVFFFLPEAIAVLELSSRMPQEGGIYAWSKAAYGEFHGFISGWCYWTNNLFYIPTLFFYIVGFSAYIGGAKTIPLGDARWYVVSVSLVCLWGIVILNIIGLGTGKWVQNAGGIGTFLTALIIIGISVMAFTHHGLANPFHWSNLIPKMADWRIVSTFSLICFAFVGLELGSVMGDEIKNPAKNIPRAVILGGASCVLLYMLSTLALQATLPIRQISVTQGVLQAVDAAVKGWHLPGLLPLLALLLTVSVAGTACAWISGSARIPFVIGIDRYLPRALGKIHPKYNTPHIALWLQGIVSTILILVNAVGSNVREEYRILLDTAVIIQLIPFLYMFGALMKARSFQNTKPYFKNAWPGLIAGISGFTVTLIGILLAFVPPDGTKNIGGYEIKVVGETTAFIIPALFFYWKSRRRKIIEVDPRAMLLDLPPIHEGESRIRMAERMLQN